MCQHKYKLFEASNSKCKLPEFFNEYRDCLSFELEYDQEDVCIFHSLDLEWKKDRFLIQLVELINVINLINEVSGNSIGYRFIEFQIVGGDNSFGITSDLKLPYHLDFRNAVFHNAVKFTNTEFGYANFEGVEIKMFAGFHNCVFQNLNFKEALIDGMSFVDNTMIGFSNFEDTIFKRFCNFSNTKFNGSLSFRDCKFLRNDDNLDVRFEDCEFEGELDFNNARFESSLSFRNSIFHNTSEFIDTIFDVKSHLGFYHIKVHNFLIFKSTSETEKLFNNTVAFVIDKEDISGRIIFENVNFLNIFKEHRNNLITLQIQEKVEIGKGCIKYPLRSPTKKLQINDINKSLVTELANTFAQFFNINNGINLGVEIENRTKDYVELFYFSDEDMTYAEFESMLLKSETEMWRLINIKDQSITGIRDGMELNGREKFIMATDTIINLISLTLKIGTRLSVGKMSQKELNSLTSTISNNPGDHLIGNQFENLNVNQTIILGFGSSQKLSL